MGGSFCGLEPPACGGVLPLVFVDGGNGVKLESPRDLFFALQSNHIDGNIWYASRDSNLLTNLAK